MSCGPCGERAAELFEGSTGRISDLMKNSESSRTTHGNFNMTRLKETFLRCRRQSRSVSDQMKTYYYGLCSALDPDIVLKRQCKERVYPGRPAKTEPQE